MHLKKIFFILSLTFFFLPKATAQVIINEFMAKNVTTDADMIDYDDFSDWIELYNTQNTTVNLTGYSITDNLNDPTKWPIPEGTIIPPFGFLLIRADGFDAAPGKVSTREFYPWATFTAQRYHTNFKLDVLGEHIGLFKSSGSGTEELIDSVIFEHQIKDVSAGRNPNDNYNWYYYGEPTPGAANNTNPTLSAELSGPVTFSLKGGFYSGQQILTLTTPVPGSEIFYTTDGSIPSTRSLKYTSPVIINKNSVIRARSFTGNKLPGEVFSNTYLINEAAATIPVISLITDPLTIWDSQIGIYTNNFKGREFPLTVEYFHPDGNSKFKVNAGAKLAGFDIWSLAQKPINIYMDPDYGNDVISYQMFPGKSIAAFTSFELRNGGDNWARSFIPDDLAESIIKGQMPQVAYLSYKPCIIYLNGQYWGIHDLRERSELQYFASNFNVDPVGVEYLGYVPINTSYNVGLEVFEGTVDSYNAFLSYIQNNDLSIKENYDYIVSQMDINSFIDYISIETYICNTSWRHNREWWRSTTGDGKWRWLIQDIDRGFNLSNRTRNILPDYISGYPVLNKLLQNENFNNKFIQQFAAHLNSTFESGRISGITDSVSKEIAPEMPRHIERWKDEGGIQSMASWENEINRIKQFALQRTDNVFTHINNQFELNGTFHLNIALNTSGSGKFLVNGIPLCGSLTELKFFKNIPMQITAIPNNGFRFTGWGDNLNDSTITLTFLNDTTINAMFELSGDIILPANINANTTLDITGNNYVASGDITVEPGKTLTIKKGVNIRMPESAGIYVKGNLIIEGTEEQPVSILPNQSTGEENWGALCFDNSTGKNSISYLTIKNATAGKDPLNQKAAISCINSDVVLDHINIENVVFPIFALNGSTVLRNSILSATGTCDYIGVKRGQALIENNTFYGNKSPDTDAIDLDGDDGAIVRGNRIYNFNAFNCDAIDIGEECKNILITGNVIYNSRDKGVSVGQLSEATIENNIIVGCDIGVAVKDISRAVIINNTFFRNNYAVACYEKNYGDGGGFAEVKNSILSASKYGSLFVDSLSSANVSYSFSDMDILPGTNNLFGDPMFTDQFNFNLQLKPGSPCFNTGDPGMPDDPDGTRTDIGAYYLYNENDIGVNIRSPYLLSVVINEIMYNDGGITDSKDWIELYNPTNHVIDVSGWKLTDEDSLHSFSLSPVTNLNPNEYIVLCRDAVKFNEAHPGVNNYIGNFDFGLDGNDKVILYDSTGEIINLISYKNSEPWASADGNGATLELRNPYGFNYQTINWKVSEGSGTPGRQNSVYEPLGIKQHALIPAEYKLEQNYPNPFNPSTNFGFRVAHSGLVTIKIYDVLGSEIATIVNQELSPGEYHIPFSTSQNSLASGIYFYRMTAGTFSDVKKFVVLK